MVITLAHRWGLTAGAYNKYAYIFDKELPVVITCDGGTLTQACYVRDVIKFAHQNQLKGADWYGNVKVTVVDENTIKVLPKQGIQIMDGFPTNSLFDVMNLIQDNKIQNGYKTFISDDLDELKAVCDALGWEYIDHGNKLVELHQKDG